MHHPYIWRQGWSRENEPAMLVALLTKVNRGLAPGGLLKELPRRMAFSGDPKRRQCCC